jgi:hypothetical protein
MRIFGLTRFGLVVVAAATAMAAGCTGHSAGGAGLTPAPTPPGTPTRLGTPSPQPGACAVTVPRPVPTTEPWRDSLFGSNSAHGNGKLWVGGLGQTGVIDAGPDAIETDGSVGMKFGWWRAVPGALRITGRRLDAAASPVRSSVPDGYGDTGFQSSGVHFPTPGCWEVTGRVGTTSLTFVTLVRVDARPEPTPPARATR